LRFENAQRPTAIAVPLDDGVLAFTLPEFDPGNLVLISPGAEPRFERVGDLAEDGRRGDLLLSAAEEEVDDAAPALQPRKIRVEVEPVDAAHFQSSRGL
jgi:hypothetical protein